MAWILLVAVLLSATGASAQPDTAVEAGDETELETLTFTRLIVREQGRYDIAVAAGTFRVTIIEELRRRGYNVTGAESLLFDQDRSSKAALLLGGIVQDVECTETAGQSAGVCEVAVAWELFSRRLDKVVYKVLTRSRDNVSLSPEEVENEAHKLLIAALGSLLEREQFQQLLEKDALVQAAAPEYEQAEYAECAATEHTLPDDMEQVLDATVLVNADERTGSGYYISTDGLVLTTNHLVAGTELIRVKNRDGTQVEAAVLRSDPAHDVALLATGEPVERCLAPAAETPQTGEEVFIVGSPAGEDLAFSVSRGIVSGHREWEGQRFVQTDASINAGSSGGPMVNGQGRVVATISWKIALPGFEGLGFGVPFGASLDRLALAPGEATAIPAGESAGAAAAEPQEYPIVDEDDPPFAEPKPAAAPLELSVQDGEKVHFYNASRVAWFISSMAITSAGVSLIASTYNEHLRLEDSHEAGETSDNDAEEIFDTLTILNTVGWAVAGLGVGNLLLFLLTGKEQQELQQEPAAAAAALSIELNGSGLTIRGRF
jgi:S1-C subfamily serine protease